MSKYKFKLNKRQIQDMEEKNWDVVPNGAFINLYPEDFDNSSAWSEICEQLDVGTDVYSVTVCYIGVISKYE